jgi:hypothetical protein
MGRGKSRRSLELIEASLEILAEIQPATVRAVCYRLFTRGLISSMARTETNRVSRQLTDAREQGLIPWPWIVDETRSVEALPTWDDPAAFGETVMAAYRRNKWAGQPKRIEVWSEKGTVRGTLKSVLAQFEVAFRVMHGYASATAVNQVVDDCQDDTLVLYVGDWDPSGLHMSEIDLPGRLAEYGGHITSDGSTGLEIRRVALVAADLAGLPSFEASTKRRDPRYGWFVTRYGRTCWELDALSPNILRDRVRAAIIAELDHAAWDRYVRAERLERESIESAIRTWKAISMPASECEGAPGDDEPEARADEIVKDALIAAGFSWVAAALWPDRVEDACA